MSLAADAAAPPPASDTAPPAATPPAPAAAPPAAPPPAAAPPAAPSPWYADDGLKVAPEVREYLKGKNFPDLPTALQSAMLADQAIRSRNVIELPASGKAAEWAAGFKALGWTEDRAAYQVPMPDGAAEVGWSPEDHAKFTDAAHGLKLAPFQAAQLASQMAAEARADKEALARQAEAGREALARQLRDTWGADHDRRMTMAQRAFRALATPEAGAKLEAALGSFEVMQMFDRIGSMLGEDTLIAGSGGATGPLGREAAQAEIRRMRGDAEFFRIMEDSRHPQHEDMMRKWNALHKAAQG